MRISDWSSDVCSSDLPGDYVEILGRRPPHLDPPTVQLSVIGVASEVGIINPAGAIIIIADRAHRELIGDDRRVHHGIDVFASAAARRAAQGAVDRRTDLRSEEHTSELQSLMRISYAVFCLKNTT